MNLEEAIPESDFLADGGILGGSASTFQRWSVSVWETSLSLVVVVFFLRTEDSLGAIVVPAPQHASSYGKRVLFLTRGALHALLYLFAASSTLVRGVVILAATEGTTRQC